MDEKISQALANEGLRLAGYEPGWFWKCLDENDELVTLWVTDVLTGKHYTVESVKAELPIVKVRWNGKLYWGNIHGRQNNFASVSPFQKVSKKPSDKTFIGPSYEFAWETIVNSLNNDTVLIID